MFVCLFKKNSEASASNLNIIFVLANTFTEKGYFFHQINVYETAGHR